MKPRRPLLLLVLALLGGSSAAYAASAPTPKLPSKAPTGKRSFGAPKLSTAARRKLAKSCKQFASASKKNLGWVCIASGKTAPPTTSWADRRVVTYGIGTRQIGSLRRGVNINMKGQQAQHGLSLVVVTGPQIWPYWAAGCRRYNNPPDRANCGNKSGNSPTWTSKYSTGWNFTPFSGNSQMRTIFSIDIFAKGYKDPNGVRGAFPLAQVVSALYQCPKVGTTVSCKFVGP